jgi:hypothetical protein
VSPPVFIVGMHGSGTTMLLDHLNSHSMIFGFRLETKILPYYLRNAYRYGDLSDDEAFLRLFSEMRHAYPIRKANAGRPLPLPDDWRRTARTVGSVFDNLMTQFASRESKARWCEKSPLHVLHMVELSKVFPGAQFIHVIRDGRDCAASFHRRWRYDPANTIQQWKECIRAAHAQRVALGSRAYHEVRYERLTSQPVPVLRQVCDYLELPYEPAILISSRSAARVRGVESRQILRTDRSFRTYFDSAVIERLERIAGSTLHALGYETRYPDADRDLPAMRLRIVRLRDQLRLGVARLGQNVLGARKLPWKMLWLRFRRGMRQN